MRVPPFLSLASPSFFPSPPASLFHPLRPVTNTQSRRCPYRKSPTHREERGGVCVSRCVGDPSESRIECRRTNKKMHSALTPPPRRTLNYDTLMKIPPTCFRHSPRVSIERMEFSLSCQLRGISIFNDIPRLVNRFAMNWITIANLIYDANGKNSQWK